MFLNIRHTCGLDLKLTPEDFLVPMLTHRGWVWNWEGDDLVMALPGWRFPAPVNTAIQPGLFDSATGRFLSLRSRVQPATS